MRRAGELTAQLDETRNYGEIGRELLLHLEAEVVLDKPVRRCWSNSTFVQFLQLED